MGWVCDCDMVNKWIPLFSVLTLSDAKQERKKSQMQMLSLTVNGPLINFTTALLLILC